jgi:hypothetical protein
MSFNAIFFEKIIKIYYFSFFSTFDFSKTGAKKNFFQDPPFFEGWLEILRFFLPHIKGKGYLKLNKKKLARPFYDVLA